MDQEQRERAWLDGEEHIRERMDEDGTRWRKVYFGGGAHLENWLSQCMEISGEANVKLEQVESVPLACFDQGGEGLYRIWVRQGTVADLDE